MPIDLRNIGAISPNGTGNVTVTNQLTVTGDVDITGTPAPVYRINGVPIGGGVTSISPGSLTGAVTLSAGANVSITQTGQAITIASTGGGSGSSQWIDIAGGGIYYGGGNVGIGTANPQGGLDLRTYRGWAIFANNVEIAPPPAVGALFLGWNFSGGAAESNIGWNGSAITFTDFSSGAAERMRITNGGQVAIGTTTPISTFHVYGGRSLFQNPSEAICMAVWGSGAGGATYLGTDGNASLTIHDYLGNVKYMLTQGGVLAVNAAAPFDPGNPHLQVSGGLCVNGMADNAMATIRMVSQDQAWGAFWNYQNQNLMFGITAAWDPYGWVATWPMSIDCGTGVVTIGNLSATGITTGNLTATGNIQCNGTVNAAAFTVNGQPLQTMGSGWTAFACDIRNSVGNTPIALNWGYAWYNVQGNLCFISIMFNVAQTAPNTMHTYLPFNQVGFSQNITAYSASPAGNQPASNVATLQTATTTLSWAIGTFFTNIAGGTWILSGVYQIA